MEDGIIMGDLNFINNIFNFIFIIV